MDRQAVRVADEIVDVKGALLEAKTLKSLAKKLQVHRPFLAAKVELIAATKWLGYLYLLRRALKSLIKEARAKGIHRYPYYERPLEKRSFPHKPPSVGSRTRCWRGWGGAVLHPPIYVCEGGGSIGLVRGVGAEGRFLEEDYL